ncbi:MAG: Ribose ABC transport system, ATP-binding protein RbsA, partial [uncultured Thermomicrobiales bacterium]
GGADHRVRGHQQAVWRGACPARCLLRRRARRGARPGRRERLRQVDADPHLRRGVPAGRGHAPLRRAAGVLRHPAPGAGRRDQHRPPGDPRLPRPDGGAERVPRARSAPPRAVGRLAGAQPPGRSALRPARGRPPADGVRRRPVGRPAADGGDRPRAVGGRQAADPGRADLRPEPAGGRAAVRDRPGLEGARRDDRLRLPPAGRGVRRRRPHLGPARRPVRWDRASGRGDARGRCQDDGRPGRGVAVPQVGAGGGGRRDAAQRPRVLGARALRRCLVRPPPRRDSWAGRPPGVGHERGAAGARRVAAAPDRRDPPRGGADPARLGRRRHRPSDRLRPRRPPGGGPLRADVGARERHPPAAAEAGDRARLGADAGAGRDRPRHGRALPDPGAVGRRPGLQPLRRQPAEGGHRPVALDRATGDPPRRPDARHRRGGQGGGPRDPRQADRAGVRRAARLVGAAGGAGDERPAAGDGRRPGRGGAAGRRRRRDGDGAGDGGRRGGV